MNVKKKIVFIINPHAGIGHYKKVTRLIAENIDISKYDYRIETTHYKDHGKELTQQAIQENIDIVVAVGGDGTINEVARVLVGTEVALGVISTGSGNGLAHHLGISTNIKKAIKIINIEKTSPIDTLLVNDNVCISIAGVGFDGLVAEMFDRLPKRGLFSYVKCVTRAFFSYKSQNYVIENKKGKTREHTALLVSFANSSQWGFNVKIAPEASLTDGYVDVCFLKKPNFFTLFFRAIALFSGNLHRYKEAADIYHFSECKIYAKNNIPQPFHIDGDTKERQKVIQVKVIPRSLRIILP